MYTVHCTVYSAQCTLYSVYLVFIMKQLVNGTFYRTHELEVIPRGFHAQRTFRMSVIVLP